jgi:hypothetical protein
MHTIEERLEKLERENAELRRQMNEMLGAMKARESPTRRGRGSSAAPLTAHCYRSYRSCDGGGGE